MFAVKKKPQKPGDVVLAVDDVFAINNKGVTALNGVTLDVRSGEILGIAGVSGNGQSELAEVITGLRECSGSIRVKGKEVANKPPITAINSGVSHVPEDRTRVGSAPTMSITENTIMKCYRLPPVGSGLSIDFGTGRRNGHRSQR